MWGFLLLYIVVLRQVRHQRGAGEALLVGIRPSDTSCEGAYARKTVQDVDYHAASLLCSTYHRRCLCAHSPD